MLIDQIAEEIPSIPIGFWKILNELVASITLKIFFGVIM
jgi:hypothetical protein